MKPEKIVVFTGAGVSAESGLNTFRDSGGLWENFRIEDVATPEAWARDPQLVLDFYNLRRKALESVEPNPAHFAIAELEKEHEVVVITQNVDDLHERGGSSKIIHLHGSLLEVKSSIDPTYKIPYPKEGLSLDHRCPRGGRMRPDIVWFGEAVENFEIAIEQLQQADKVLVIGTSLSVYPAAGLVHEAPAHAEKTIIALDLDFIPDDYRFIHGTAGEQVPKLTAEWLEKG